MEEGEQSQQDSRLVVSRHLSLQTRRQNDVFAWSCHIPHAGLSSIKILIVPALLNVYVYGFSLGANTALHLAANRPDKVKMLIAHAASNHLDGYNEEFAGTPDMTPEVVEEYAQWWLEGHLKRTPEPDKWKKFIYDMQKVWYPKEFISDSRLQSIRASTLIVQGDKDLIRITTAHHIHHQIKNSQLAILPNTTHFVHGEDPELLLDIIVPFLTKRPKQTFEWVY